MQISFKNSIYSFVSYLSVYALGYLVLAHVVDMMKVLTLVD
jgi:hypothetical protein